jgi:hypothetical protein
MQTLAINPNPLPALKVDKKLMMRLRRTAARQQRRANRYYRQRAIRDEEYYHEKGYCGLCSPGCGLS